MTAPPTEDVPIRFVPLDLIDGTPPEKNNNFMSDRDFRGLVNGIRLTGFNQPIALSLRTADGRYTTIDGTHRSKAMRLLGHAEIPAKVYVDLTEAQIVAKRASLNKWRGQIKADVERTDARLMHAAGWEIADLSDLTGYSPPDLETLLEVEPAVDATSSGGLPDIPDPGDGGEPLVARTGAIEIKIPCSSEEAKESLLALLKQATRAAKARGKFKVEAGIHWALDRALAKE